MPLVLTTNEIVLNPDHAWNDIEGVQYHYPNQYKNKIKPGERFVYYRGVNRKDGKRAQAEYFGRGVIGEIRPDPDTVGQTRPSWFCAIEDYQPFSPPHPAKTESGEYLEKIPQNMWRNGVRDLPEEIYNQILNAAGAGTPENSDIVPIAGITESSSLLIPKNKIVAGSKGASGGWRKSKQSKQVGDWAENKAMEYVRDVLGGVDVIHRAGLGEKPGWDFDYKDKLGALRRVEVKGTVAGGFTSFDFTVGEYSAAKAHKDSYWIFLVASCMTDRPKIQMIQDPASMIAGGGWSARSVLFNVTFGPG